MTLTNPGLTLHLLFTAGVIAVASSLILVRHLSPRLTALIVGVKVGIPTAYFAWFVSSRWIHPDGLTYANVAMRLIQEGAGPLILFTPEGVGRLRSIAGGIHILYYWWNITSITLFGQHFYAPIFLNVLLSIVSAVVFVGVLREIGFSEEYRRWCLVFVLLHWEVLAWTSLNNIKGTLVVLLTVTSLYGFVIVFKHAQEGLSFRVAYGGMLIGLSFFLLYSTRFYVPVLVTAAALGWLFLHWQNPKKYVIIVVGALSILLLAMRWSHALRLLQLQPVSLYYGFVRFTLTPRPWGVVAAYSYLALPALFHWLFVPFAGLGALRLVAKSRLSRFFVLFAAIVLAFFAAVPELQGPRHRFWIYFLFAWFGFHFWWERIRVRFVW